MAAAIASWLGRARPVSRNPRVIIPPADGRAEEVSLAAVWWPEARAGELVAYLDDEELARLLAVTEVAEAGAGDFLLHRGSPSRSLLLVEDGEIEIVDESLGETVVLGRVGPGGVVGEVGFLDGQPRTHHVRAGTACRVRRLTRDGLLALGAGRAPALRQGLPRPGRARGAPVPARARGARPPARVRGVAGRPRGGARAQAERRPARRRGRARSSGARRRARSSTTRSKIPSSTRPSTCCASWRAGPRKDLAGV